MSAGSEHGMENAEVCDPNPKPLDFPLHSSGTLSQIVLGLQHLTRLDQHLVVRHAVADLVHRRAMRIDGEHAPPPGRPNKVDAAPYCGPDPYISE